MPPGELADAEQPPVQPQPGQPGLVPPVRPGHRRAGRRFPRLEPAVEPRTAGCARPAYFDAHGLRLKPLVAWIMKSQTYQLSATPGPDATPTTNPISRTRRCKLLPAEVLLDAISQVLGVPERFPARPARCGRPSFPGPCRASAFLKSFGKPDRLLTCECERSDATTLAQAFQMINGETVRRKLELRVEPDRQAAGRTARAIARSAERVLSRPRFAASRRAAERAAVAAHISARHATAQGWEDVVWALLNSKEFLLRH